MLKRMQILCGVNNEPSTTTRNIIFNAGYRSVTGEDSSQRLDRQYVTEKNYDFVGTTGWETV